VTRRTRAERTIRRIEITGDMDRHAAEALYLELRRLAQRHGLEVADVRVDKVGESLPGLHPA
jgi:hypothetical protein